MPADRPELADLHGRRVAVQLAVRGHDRLLVGNGVLDPNHPLGRVKAWLRDLLQCAHYTYNREALQAVLTETLGERLFGDSQVRLCIPAFEGRHSEVFVFKTPHHADYRTDRDEGMDTVGLATAAAPTYFRPLEHGGYVLVDGGVWANNPVMLAVIEARGKTAARAAEPVRQDGPQLVARPEKRPSRPEPVAPPVPAAAQVPAAAPEAPAGPETTRPCAMTVTVRLLSFCTHWRVVADSVAW